MSKVRFKKVAYRLLISLVVFTGMLLPGLSSFAAIPQDDATLVYSTVPNWNHGWSGYAASTGVQSGDLVDTYSTISRSGANTQFQWRLTQYFTDDPNFQMGNRYITFTAWTYTDNLYFYDQYVYQFDLAIRWRNINASSSEINNVDFSKFYLVFGLNSITNYQTLSYSFISNSVMFQPASYTVNGAYVFLTYNVPIYPSTDFRKLTPSVDSDGTYYTVPYMGIYNNGSGAMHLETNNGQTRLGLEYFLQTSSAARVYTPDQWSAHVQEQGFNDLSNQINISTGQIISAIDDQTSDITNAIDNAADDIINAGDPVDFSGLDFYHDQESALIDSILSTAPYDPDDATAIFNTSNWSTLLKGATFTNNWYNYVFANNSLIGFLLTLGMAFAIAHQALKGLL